MRELIINVDDIGIHGGAVGPAIEAISDGLAASGSVMAVCPGASQAYEALSGRPDIPIGVHLTLLADFPAVPWMPLTGGASIQDGGRLFGAEDRDRLLAQADKTEVEAEFRAQIEHVLAAGIRVTHLDWHSLHDGGRPDLFDLTLDLAVEYGVGIRAWAKRSRAAAAKRGFAIQNLPFLDSFTLATDNKVGHLIARASSLPPGLSEWAMHPALPLTADPGRDVRASDHEALMSEELRARLDEEGIRVIGYGDERFRP